METLDGSDRNKLDQSYDTTIGLEGIEKREERIGYALFFIHGTYVSIRKKKKKHVSRHEDNDTLRSVCVRFLWKLGH